MHLIGDCGLQSDFHAHAKQDKRMRQNGNKDKVGGVLNALN